MWSLGGLTPTYAVLSCSEASHSQPGTLTPFAQVSIECSEATVGMPAGKNLLSYVQLLKGKEVIMFELFKSVAAAFGGRLSEVPEARKLVWLMLVTLFFGGCCVFFVA